MNVLSFDCANRSLAVCFATVHKDKMTNLKKAIDDEKNTTKKKQFDDFIDVHFIKVFDLTKGEKYNTIQRSKLLKDCLKSIDVMISGYKIPSHILIEYQMSANDKSRCVSQQILYHYTNDTTPEITLVGPTLKNKVKFSADDSLDHSTFMEKYASKYTANKNHTKSNFLHWVETTDNQHIIKNMKKKNYDDAADSLMQIFGWIKF